MKKSQLVLYVVFGLVIFLVILGLATFTLQLFSNQKVISTQDVNNYVSNCLELSLKCSLYTTGLNLQSKSLDNIKKDSQDYVKKSLNTCFGDLSSKFKGNKFKFEQFSPIISFNSDTTSINLPKLGEMNGGNARKVLENFAAKVPIAFTSVYNLASSMSNNQKEKIVDNIDPRFKVAIYQIDDTKEAVIITDSLSKLGGKEYKVLSTN